MKGLSGVEKQIAIKTKVIERLQKEYLSYVKEFNTEQTKLAKMEEEKDSAGNVKRQEFIVEETRIVKNDVKGKLIKEKENLESMIEEIEDAEVQKSGSFIEATECLKKCEVFINQQVLVD